MKMVSAITTDVQSAIGDDVDLDSIRTSVGTKAYTTIEYEVATEIQVDGQPVQVKQQRKLSFVSGEDHHRVISVNGPLTADYVKQLMVNEAAMFENEIRVVESLAYIASCFDAKKGVDLIASEIQKHKDSGKDAPTMADITNLDIQTPTAIAIKS